MPEERNNFFDQERAAGINGTQIPISLLWFNGRNNFEHAFAEIGIRTRNFSECSCETGNLIWFARFSTACGRQTTRKESRLLSLFRMIRKCRFILCLILFFCFRTYSSKKVLIKHDFVKKCFWWFFFNKSFSLEKCKIF